MKFYIAFSIHGTNKFTVATYSIPNKQRSPGLPHQIVKDLFGPAFTIAPSRRPNYDASKDGIKLHWNRLVRKDGTPIQNKGWVTKRFNQLNALGWTIVPANPCTH